MLFQYNLTNFPSNYLFNHHLQTDIQHNFMDNLFCKQVQKYAFQTITISMHINYNGLKCILLDRISIVLPEPGTAAVLSWESL